MEFEADHPEPTPPPKPVTTGKRRGRPPKEKIPVIIPLACGSILIGSVDNIIVSHFQPPVVQPAKPARSDSADSFSATVTKVPTPPPPAKKRPARRVKSDIKYRVGDSDDDTSTSDDGWPDDFNNDNYDDDDTDEAKKRKKKAAAKKPAVKVEKEDSKSATSDAKKPTPTPPATTPAPPRKSPDDDEESASSSDASSSSPDRSTSKQAPIDTITKSTASAAAATSQGRPAAPVGLHKTTTAPATSSRTPLVPKFHCHLCPHMFKREGWLRQHLVKAHSEPATAARQPIKRSASDAAADDEEEAAGRSGESASPAQLHSSSGATQPKQYKHSSALLASKLAAHATSRSSSGSRGMPVPLPAVDVMTDLAQIRGHIDAAVSMVPSQMPNHLDQIFRHSNRMLVWLKRQTARPDPQLDARRAMQWHSEMLHKQTKIYDTITQLVAAKQDQLHYAFEDFVKKQGAQMYEMKTDEEMEEQQQQVELEYQLHGDEGSNDGEFVTSDPVPTKRQQQTVIKQEKVEYDFEILDPQTGRTMKLSANGAEGDAEDVEDDEENYQLVDVIDVSDDDEDD